MNSDLLKTSDLPKIGLGTMLANTRKAKNGLLKGIKIGFRFLDTAQIYFNERVVGKAIKESGIPREEFIIATKIWVCNFGPKRLKRSTNLSLKRLGVNAIDMLYLHWPFRFKHIDKTIGAMNELVEEGKIRSIAVSNYTPKHVDKVLELSNFGIIANQIEFHPWLQQKELIAHHNKAGVKVVGYFPLMHGRFKQVKEFEEIAKKYNATSAQICLAWEISKGVIPIPKSVTESHLRDNFEAQKIKLEKEDIEKIDAISKNKRFLNPPILAPNW